MALDLLAMKLPKRKMEQEMAQEGMDAEMEEGSAEEESMEVPEEEVSEMPSPLVDASDEDILAEAQKRGLI